MSREILHAVDVETDADTIYRAIATGEGLASFWTAEAQAEESVGSVARFRFPEAPVELKMRVDALEPGTRVAWRCEGDFPNWDGTSVEWRLSPSTRGPGTEVLFRHVGWREDYPEIECARVSYVWAQVVAHLKGFAETGRPQPFFASAVPA